MNKQSIIYAELVCSCLQNWFMT